MQMWDCASMYGEEEREDRRKANLLVERSPGCLVSITSLVYE